MLLGNFNESIYNNQSGKLHTLATNHDLYDPLKHLPKSSRDTPTFILGQHCLDFILVDKELAMSITGAGIAAFDPLLSPCHRPVFCDISFQRAYSTPPPSLYSAAGRLATTKSLETSLIFLKALDKIMTARNILPRCNKLLQRVKEYGASSKNGTHFGKLDNDFCKALTTVENHSRSSHITPWSKTLHAKVRACSLWKNICAAIRYSLPLDKKIAKHQPKTEPEIEWKNLSMDKAN